MFTQMPLASLPELGVTVGVLRERSVLPMNIHQENDRVPPSSQ